MVVTHADLELRRRRCDLGSKAGTSVVALSLFCGLLGFVLCVLAESTRSTVTWELVTSEKEKKTFKCVYSGDGRAALLCATGGFLALAVAMIVQYVYIWLAVNNNTTTQRTFDVVGESGSSSSSGGCLTRQAATAFLGSWVCFAVAEVLLLIGIAVESAHLRRWREPRESCVVVRRWSFVAAGVFDLLMVISGTSFYLLLLKIKGVRDGQASGHYTATTALRETSNESASSPSSDTRGGGGTLVKTSYPR